MYLAEDRILCWELVAKRGDAWILKYVKSATGETVRSRSLCILIETRRADTIAVSELTGCSGYSSRIHQSTTKVVERFILRLDLCTHSYDAIVRDSTFEETSFLFAHSSDLQFVSSRFRLVWIGKLCYLFFRKLAVPCIGWWIENSSGSSYTGSHNFTAR